MFLLLRLILAHLLADFPFQSGIVYKKKIGGSWGEILHAQIVGLTITALSWPYLSYHIMWFLILLFVLLHLAIDRLKLDITNRMLPIFWSFLLDQILHIGSLALVLFFSFSRQAPNLNYSFLRLYNNNTLVVMLIGYIFSSFTGTYLLGSFQKTFFPHLAPKDIPRMANYGVVERMLITTVFCFFKIYFYPLALLLFLIRIVLGKKRTVFDFLHNLFYAGLIGVLLKAFIA